MMSAKSLLPSVSLVLWTSLFPFFPRPGRAQAPAPEWTYLTEGPGQAEALAIAPGGDILAAGTSFDGAATDFLVVRLPPAGPPPRWIAVANHEPMDQISRSRSGFIVDADGACYLAGSVRHPSHDDFFVLQVRSDGIPGWAYSAHGGSFNVDGAKALALDPRGEALYAAGSVYGTGILLRLDLQTGAPHWQYILGGSPLSDLAVDPAGDAYAAGGPVVKVDSGGAQEWIYSRPNTFFRVLVLENETGNIYAAGFEYCGQYCQLLTVVKLSPLGIKQWVSSTSGFPHDLLLDEAGNVYVAGSGRDASEGSIAVIARFAAANGNVDWAHGFDGPDGAYFEAIARHGHRILAAGSSYGGLPEHDELWLIQFNEETGHLEWIYRRPYAAGSDVALGADGTATVSGRDLAGNRFLVEKLTSVTAIETVRAARAEAVAGGILVSWEIGPTSPFIGFHLDRGSTGRLEPSDRIEWVEGRDGRFAHLDRAAQPGRTYHYQIVGVRADGTEVLDSDLLIARAPEAIRTAVAVAPNPVRSGAEVRFAVPPPRGRFRLDLVDAAGRLVRTLAEDSYPGGSHRVRWDALAADIPPGTYFVRLRGPGSSATAKVVVLDQP